MINVLEVVVPAVWRASWQAAALALFIAVLLRCFGERLAPKWRYLLWGVVVIRFLFVATPVSHLSVFNLVRWDPEPDARQVAKLAGQLDILPDREPVEPTTWQSDSVHQLDFDAPVVANSGPTSPAGQISDQPVSSDVFPKNTSRTTLSSSSSPSSLPHLFFLMRYRILTTVWLAGCLLFGLKLLATAFVLHRRLSACRPVTDEAVLSLLEIASLRIGLEQTPQLLVTPESISPCIVGTWNPRIVLPESMATQSSAPALRHVLAHELAHLVRGDLWTNWLLLAARVLHWFNPVAWWTTREMQAEREAACDELALATLGQVDRSAYATTIVDLAANLVPSTFTPGMIGLFSSTRRLKARVKRLVQSPSVNPLRSPIAAGLLLVIGCMGLTDAMPTVTADQPQSKAATAAPLAKPAPAKTGPMKQTGPAKEPVPAKEDGPEGKTVTLRGRCIDRVDKSPFVGIPVRLFKAAGRTAPIVEFAKVVTDDDGLFEFPDTLPPSRLDSVDRVIYLLFAEVENRPIGVGGSWTMGERDPLHKEIRILRDMTNLSGTITDARGQPVAGATVAQWDIDGRPVPGILSAKSDVEGRFEITRIPDFKKAFGRSTETSFTISHPDYPITDLRVSELPVDVKIALADGCRVTGTVTDKVTGKPAAGALVLAEGIDAHSETPVSTDAAGHFRMMLAEGRYSFLVQARERVCLAVTDRECLDGKQLELPPLALIAGGFISGQVVNTKTGQPIAVSDRGEPIMIGLYGPSQPKGKVISPARLATVDDTGRFTMRAAPGENYPYFVNIQGDRMAWDTEKQPPVVVKEGETTAYNMLITPKVPPQEKLQAARKLVESLSKKPAERTAQIIVEFRKLDHTVDETELWCTLMRELVAVGRDAVPQLCEELDRTTENRMLRRLAFALRAIGDPRAVPALIRAIPKTLLPSSSDYGLIVEDQELTAFMQRHDLSHGKGTYFDLGRPEREICSALYTLTKQIMNDVELFGLGRSEDPRRQVLQRRIFVRHAQAWQAWWEAHWRELTDDAAYQKVNLVVVDEVLPPASKTLGPNARIAEHEGWTGAVLSPAIQQGPHAWHFYDLDTGNKPQWPAEIPKDEPKIDQKKLADWAAENGVNLMCVTHRAADGTETFVLRTFGLTAWEIGPRDLRNIDRLIAAGKLPEGREVGDLLMHYDAESEELVPAANGAFIFITREGSLGMIEVTDRVVRTQNLTGLAGQPPAGVGFHLGVRFNLRMIIP